MNEQAFRIMGLHNKIERNINLCIKLKALAFVCLFFSFCYLSGAKSIASLEKSHIIAANIVWIVSVLVLIGIFLKDLSCIKSNKANELEIYRLEVEDLNTKKEIAKITGEVLPDYIYDKKIAIPDETISSPIVFYGILIGIDVVIRLFCL